MENKSKKLEFWEQPEQLSLLRFYARRFNSLKSIAENMGIDRATLWRWQKDSPIIRETLITTGGCALPKSRICYTKKQRKASIGPLPVTSKRSAVKTTASGACISLTIAARRSHPRFCRKPSRNPCPRRTERTRNFPKQSRATSPTALKE